MMRNQKRWTFARFRCSTLVAEDLSGGDAFPGPPHICHMQVLHHRLGEGGVGGHRARNAEVAELEAGQAARGKRVARGEEHIRRLQVAVEHLRS